MSTNLVFNGDFTLLPPDPLVHTTTSLRYVNGRAGGSFTDTHGWYFSDEPVTANTAKAGFVKGPYHYGGNGIELINTTDTAKCIVSSRKIPVRGNTVYTLSFAVELDNVPTKGVYAKVNYWPTGATIANYAVVTVRLSGYAKCKLVTLDFTTSSNTGNVVIELRNFVAGRYDTNDPKPSRVVFHDIRVEEKADLAPEPVNVTTTYGVNKPLDLIATNWTTADMGVYLDKMKAMGMTMVRTDFVGQYIHPTGSGNNYLYTAYDKFTNIVNSKGMKVLPILSYDSTTLGTQEFSDYFTTIVAHFKTLGIRYYELWNEKNLYGLYNKNNDPAHYAEILKQAYPAIKAGDPTAKVLFSGITGGTIGQTVVNSSSSPEYSAPDYLEAVYAAGAGNCFDIMNYHSYGHVDAVIQAIRSIMAQYGDEYKPLAITEDGIPTGGKTTQMFTTEAGQAQYMLDGIAFAKKYSAIFYVMYNGNDSLNARPDREGYFGVTTGQLNALVEKPAYQAIKNALTAP